MPTANHLVFTTVSLGLLACASSWTIGPSPRRAAAPPRLRPAVCMSDAVDTPPPAGFEWADSETAAAAPEASAPAASTAAVQTAAPEAAAPAASAAAVKGVVKPTKPKEPKESKFKKSPKGIFAPAVLGAKAIMGQQELNQLRAKVIAEHTKVITSFVDTSESKFGQLVLKRMFAAADKDGNGTLDKEEVRAALDALGFTFLKDKQLEGIIDRADMDDNEVIDFEEFVKEAPRTLRVNLVKLAKQNGHDLGFLA